MYYSTQFLQFNKRKKENVKQGYTLQLI